MDVSCKDNNFSIIVPVLKQRRSNEMYDLTDLRESLRRNLDELDG